MKTKIICVNCLNEIDSSLEICPHCGTETKQSKSVYDYVKYCKDTFSIPETQKISMLAEIPSSVARDIAAFYFKPSIAKIKKASRPLISKIRVSKLFNDLDYEIDFNKDISIILGPNGFGKTTIFGFINFVLSPSVDLFDKHVDNVPFASFEVTLENGVSISLSRKKDNLYLYEINGGGNKIKKELSFAVDKMAKYEDDDFDDVMYRHPSGMRKKYRRKAEASVREMKEALRDASLLFDVFFIKTSRAFEKISDDSISEIAKDRMMFRDYYELRFGLEPNNRFERSFSPMSACNRDLIQRIDVCKKKYQKLIENVKNTLPKKFLRVSHPTLTPSEIKSRWEQYKDKVNKLSNFGLIEAQSDLDYLSNLSEKALSKSDNGKAAFLSLYIKEYEKTLEPFEDLYQKMVVFQEIINQRNSHNHKRIRYSSSGIGYYNNEQNIGLESLSSGEKNDFIMFYDLIFRIDNGTIVLIDEPEISLHIIWQEKFIDNVINALNNKKCQVVIATHSPNIIGNHYDYVTTTEQQEESVMED